MSDETIFALSTASARAALAVVRLSGPACDSALVALGVTRLPPPRMAGVRALAAPQNGALLDEALVLRFQAPHSFTGEAMAELHLHGGLAIVESVLAALSALPGLRAAEAGEFTRRAVPPDRLHDSVHGGIPRIVRLAHQVRRNLADRLRYSCQHAASPVLGNEGPDDTDLSFPANHE